MGDLRRHELTPDTLVAFRANLRLRSLEARIRNRFNVSLAEVEHQDLWQRARLAVVSVNTDHVHLESTLQSVAGEAGTARDIELLDAHMETL